MKIKTPGDLFKLKNPKKIYDLIDNFIEFTSRKICSYFLFLIFGNYGQ